MFGSAGTVQQTLDPRKVGVAIPGDNARHRFRRRPILGPAGGDEAARLAGRRRAGRRGTFDRRAGPSSGNRWRQPDENSLQ